MEAAMELRHLRYFIAVAEEGSLTLPAEKRLHTAQPSLSRQLRDLEYDVGVPLMSRSVPGLELSTSARPRLPQPSQPGAGASQCRGGNSARGRTALAKDFRHRLSNRSRDQLA